MRENDRVPYKAINIFMERDYLEKVVSFILNNKEKLSKEDQIEFNKFFNQYITVLGFRNPLRAPLSLQIKAYANAFEEKEEVVPFTLSTWTKLNSKFAKKVLNWLKEQSWKDLELEREYSESGGFIQNWPKKLKFDKFVKDFETANPNLKFDRDDLILMMLWISGKLPEDQSAI